MALLLTRCRLTIRRLRHDESGNIALLFAFFLSIGTALSALAVDEGALYLQRRQAQSTADLAAISAAADPGHAFARARQVFAEAGLIDPADSDAALTAGTGKTMLGVETGHYAADPAVAVTARFQGAAPSPNAVKVRFRTVGDRYFAQSWGPPPLIGVEAVASASPTVMFSIGSTLAQLSDGVPNALLNALLGANISLSAVSYNGLLNARVSVFSFLDALAQQLNISVGSYDDVLAASANEGLIAAALAHSLNGADALTAQTLAQALGHNGAVPLAKLFNLGNAGRLDIGSGVHSGYFATLSALEILTASGALSDGTHQVALNLGAGVPGLTSLKMSLAVGEPQQFASWFALGPSGTIVRTAQVRLKFVATVGGGLLLLNAGIRVPLYLDIAYAEAGVQSAACPVTGATTGSAVIAAQPGVAQLTLGDVTDAALGDFSGTPAIAPATLVSIPLLLAVTGSGQARIGQMNPTPLSFSSADIVGGTVKRVSTSDFTQSLTTSLLSTLTLDAKVLGLGLGLPSTSVIKSTIRTLIAPLGPVLDSTITATLNTLGLTLGAADVQVYGVSCGRAVLVG